MTRVCLLAFLLLHAAPVMAGEVGTVPAGAAIDRQVERLLSHTVKGDVAN